ncbi:MAG TPA: hypothetical protein VFZ41_11000, partial [Solirubrobacterales bacterium]
MASTSAWAVPGWTSPATVEPTPLGGLTFPRVVARPAGCASAVYQRGNAYASTRPPGGSFSTPQMLGSIAPGTYPEAAVRAGVAAATWSGGGKMRVSVAEGCNPFGAPA